MDVNERRADAGYEPVRPPEPDQPMATGRIAPAPIVPLIKGLTRDQILEADDLARKAVSVPQWGGTVYVRTMTGAERDAFEVSIVAPGAEKYVNLRARVVALCAVDEAGRRLFSDEDVVRLGDKSAAALEAVFDAASKLNAITPEDVAELEKNSPGGPVEDSPLR